MRRHPRHRAAVQTFHQAHILVSNTILMPVASRCRVGLSGYAGTHPHTYTRFAGLRGGWSTCPLSGCSYELSLSCRRPMPSCFHGRSQTACHQAGIDHLESCSLAAPPIALAHAAVIGHASLQCDPCLFTTSVAQTSPASSSVPLRESPGKTHSIAARSGT